MHGVTVTQDLYKNIKEEGLESYIDDKLYYVDSEIDFDKIAEERYIKTVTPD